MKITPLPITIPLVLSLLTSFLLSDIPSYELFGEGSGRDPVLIDGALNLDEDESSQCRVLARLRGGDPGFIISITNDGHTTISKKSKPDGESLWSIKASSVVKIELAEDEEAFYVASNLFENQAKLTKYGLDGTIQWGLSYPSRYGHSAFTKDPLGGLWLATAALKADDEYDSEVTLRYIHPEGHVLGAWGLNSLSEECSSSQPIDVQVTENGEIYLTATNNNCYYDNSYQGLRDGMFLAKLQYQEESIGLVWSKIYRAEEMGSTATTDYKSGLVELSPRSMLFDANENIILHGMTNGENGLVLFRGSVDPLDAFVSSIDSESGEIHSTDFLRQNGNRAQYYVSGKAIGLENTYTIGTTYNDGEDRKLILSNYNYESSEANWQYYIPADHYPRTHVYYDKTIDIYYVTANNKMYTIRP